MTSIEIPDEKHLGLVEPEVLAVKADATATGNDAAERLVDWTPSEERRAVIKQIAVCLPLMMLGFFSLQLDRGNIGQALTGTLYKDVGITQDQMNNGQTILLCMIVLFEIPSNLLLFKLGAKYWLSFQMIAWGVIATAQSRIASPAGYYATRTLLGIAEGGFIPGGVYYISTLFTHKEQAQLTAWFYVGNICGKGSSGLIASQVLGWQGRGGLPGWAWLFIVEGSVSIGIGVICLCFLPFSASRSRTIFGFKLFTEREAHILSTRVILDDPLKEHPTSEFTKANVALALLNWRMWLHAVFCILGVAVSTAVSTYNAQVIKALGFTTSKANALSAVGSWLQAPCTLFWGYMMDRTRFKGPWMIAVSCIMLLLNGVYFSFVHSLAGGGHVDKWARYAVYELIVAFGEAFFTGGLTWAVATARTPIQRSMFAAMYVMASNSGQAIGGQMFRASDKPLYLHGFTACLGLYSVCVVLAVAITLQYVHANNQLRGDAGKPMMARVPGQAGDIELEKVFMYPT